MFGAAFRQSKISNMSDQLERPRAPARGVKARELVPGVRAPGEEGRDDLRAPHLVLAPAVGDAQLSRKRLGVRG